MERACTPKRTNQALTSRAVENEAARQADQDGTLGDPIVSPRDMRDDARRQRRLIVLFVLRVGLLLVLNSAITYFRTDRSSIALTFTHAASLVLLVFGSQELYKTILLFGMTEILFADFGAKVIAWNSDVAKNLLIDCALLALLTELLRTSAHVVTLVRLHWPFWNRWDVSASPKSKEEPLEQIGPKPTTGVKPKAYPGVDVSAVPTETYYQVIGQSYMHELIDGEAIPVQNQLNIQPQMFELR